MPSLALSATAGSMIEELAGALDVELEAVVPMLRVLRAEGRIEADGKGHIRRAPVNDGSPN